MSAFRHVLLILVAVGVCAASLMTTAAVASASVVGQSLSAGTVASHEASLGVPVAPSSAFVAMPVAFMQPAGPTAWSVSLVADNTNIVEGQQATLTAYASAPLDGSGLAIYIYGFSPAWAIPHLMATPCESGSSCQATVDWEAEPANYQAFIAPAGEPFDSVQGDAAAISDTVTIPSTSGSGGGGGPLPWQVSLMVSPTLLPVGKSVTVVATANQSVAGSGDQVVIVENSPAPHLNSCGTSNGCTWTVKWNSNPQTYQAFIGMPTSLGVANVVAQSAPVTVTSLDWQVQLFTSGKDNMGAFAYANRPVGPSTSTAIMIYDEYTRQVLKKCLTGQTCEATVSHKGDSAEAFIVPDTASKPSGVWLARSGWVTFPDGGTQASAAALNDGKVCACEPIDPATGRLTEEATDISVAGRGPGLVLARAYDSGAAGIASRFGYGWTDGYTMHLNPAPNQDGTMPASLAAATSIQVVQENGAAVTFYEQADGSFTAAANVLASLTRNADGSYSFVRVKTSVFTFDSYGQLSAVADLHGNSTTLSYNDDSGALSTISDSAGRTLTYSYNDQGLVQRVDGPGGRFETYSYDGAGNLVAASDETGATWRYGYDALHELTAMTDPDGNTTINAFDDLGRVVAQTDGRGMTTTFTYNDDGSTMLTHPAGNITTYTYRDGLLVQRTEGTGIDSATWQYQYDPITHGLAQLVDPDHHVNSYAHDAAGNITSTTDPTGATTTYSYDGLNDQTSVIDPTGAKTTRAFDALGDLLTETDPTSVTTSYGYDAHGDQTSATDPNGHTTRYGYNNAGDLTSTTDPAGATTGMVVDAVGDITSITDPLGRTTSLGYDPRGLLTSTTNANDETTSYGYDRDANKTATTDATNRTWTSTYDAAGNMVRTTNPDGSFIATAYDPDGRVASVADAAGNTTSYAYDSLGRAISASDPTGARTSYSYDPGGLLTSSTTPNGGTTHFSYDADGRATSVTDPRGGTSSSVYDADGRVISTMDQAGNATGYRYDPDGRPTATTLPDGSTEQQTYDPDGLLLSNTDAAGNTTNYAYDADARKSSTTNPNGRTTSYAYDTAGELVASTDPAGRVSHNTYDAAGRLMSTTYSDPATPGVAYGYDAAGRELSMSDGTGATSDTYDQAGRLTQVTNPTTGTVGYSYDGLGRIAEISYPDGRVVSRSYDPAGRLAAESDGVNNTTSFTYDGDGNLVAVTYPNGVVQQQSFDVADQMTATSVNSASTTLAAFSYQLDPLGLATSVTATGSAAPARSPAAQSYAYNPLQQLTAVTTGSNAGGSGSPSGGYSYDKAGNVTALPDGSTLAYDAASQLTGSVGPGAIGTGYGFDPTGDRANQTTGGLTSTFGYDQASELTSVNIPARSPYHLMAGGEFFSLAVRGDGSVRAWGDNSFGELGDGGACGTTCPTQITVPGLPTILQVAAGRDHALAVSTDGRVYAWGANSHGQLGNATATTFDKPIQVPGLSDVLSVAAAGDSSYALTKDGKVYSWGENDQGQLGDGTTTGSASPILVKGLPPVADISAGALPDGPTHLLAATNNGLVYTWGDSSPHPADPTQAGDPTGAGGSGGTSCKTDNGGGNGGTPGNGKGHTNNGNGNAGGCKTDNGVGNGGTPGDGNGNGAAGGFGDNGNGGTRNGGGGNGGIPGNGHGHQVADLTPTLVIGVDHVIQVAAGGTSSYALTSAGTVFAWGDNHYGELGLGLPADVQTVDQPTPISGLPTIKMVAAGGAHAVALTTRGQVFGWGDDNTGQLAAPGPECALDDPKTCPAPQLIDGVTASAVAAGYVHTLIATVYERVDGVGRDAEGELGDGYAHPATQVGPAGDRNALDTPDGGVGGAKYDLTPAAGVAQIRPQAPVRAAYTYTGDGLRATATTTVDDTTTVVPTTVSNTYTWDTQATTPALLSDGTHDYLTGPNGLVFEQTDILGKPSSSGTVFLHADRLGSTRLLTNTEGQPAGAYSYTPTGVRIQDDGLALLPYAQGIPPLQTDTNLGYAGAYTDPGTGWLYLQARYDDPVTGQFTSVDPLIDQTGQTYSYADNDPVNNNDPTGLGCAICGAYDWAVENLDPAYTAIEGGYDAYQVASHNCPAGEVWAYSIEGGIGALGTVTDAAGVTNILGKAAGKVAAKDAAKESATAAARRLGKEGEAQVAGTGNTELIQLASGKLRRPDILDHGAHVLGEVKNVKKLSYTKQLHDYIDWAKANGYKVKLYVRAGNGTHVSQKLLDEIANSNGEIQLFKVLQ